MQLALCVPLSMTDNGNTHGRGGSYFKFLNSVLLSKVKQKLIVLIDRDLSLSSLPTA